VRHGAMEKLVLLIITGLLIFSCRTKDKKVQIEEILGKGNYEIVCMSQGCFGSGIEKLEVKNNETVIYTYRNSNDLTGSFEKKRQIAWDSEKLKVLREILETGINFRDTEGYCTTTAKYKLTNSIQSVEFEDMNCELMDKFESLIR
jgi:hypothetical protein